MGSDVSRIKRHLLDGNENGVLSVFYTSDVRMEFDPNASYGESYGHNTSIHIAALHAMPSALKALINIGGNPNIQNGKNATALHLVCNSGGRNDAKGREDCLEVLLNWHSPDKPDEIDISATDIEGNTALHYAAKSGLAKCVEMLLQRQPRLLYSRNNMKEFPLDLAFKHGHISICSFLEKKVVFSEETWEFLLNVFADRQNEKEIDLSSEDLAEAINAQGGTSLPYIGLSYQDLQEDKDKLLVETSDMLHVQLFVSEALLRKYEWNLEQLLEAWVTDSMACCQECQITPPASALKSAPVSQVQEEYHSGSLSSPAHHLHNVPLDLMCDICGTSISNEDQKDLIAVPCDHLFCTSCWDQYLTQKIQDGQVHNVLCPAYECYSIVPVEVIEKVVSPEMVRRYLQFDIEAYVDDNPSIKWCPFPACGRAVKITAPIEHHASLDLTVDCGSGHFFCWECLEPAHAPCSCETWKEWLKKIASLDPKKLANSSEKKEEAANSLWLACNSKNCPKCHSPIQKNDGCNHMKCLKCRHEFCWVCLEPWSAHNTARDGYFNCTLSEAAGKVQSRSLQLKNEAENRSKEMEELEKLDHTYSSFKFHLDKYQQELHIFKVLQEKTRSFLDDPSCCIIHSPNFPNPNFLLNAVLCLLHNRRVLSASHAYNYFLMENNYRKTHFLRLQKGVNQATECLAGLINAPYIKAPYCIIIGATHKAIQKRQKFLKGIKQSYRSQSMSSVHSYHMSDLDSPPIEDEELHKAVLASLQDFNAENPWVRASNGVDANITNILRSFSDEEEEEDDDSSSLTISSPSRDICRRKGCSNRVAPLDQSSGTSGVHCSTKCQLEDMLERQVSGDEEMDGSVALLIAMEMSRLQLVEDDQRRRERLEQDDMFKDLLDGSFSNFDSTKASSGTPTSDTGLVASPSADDEIKRAFEQSFMEFILNDTSDPQSIGPNEDFDSISLDTPVNFYKSNDKDPSTHQ